MAVRSPLNEGRSAAYAPFFNDPYLVGDAPGRRHSEMLEASLLRGLGDCSLDIKDDAYRVGMQMIELAAARRKPLDTIAVFTEGDGTVEIVADRFEAGRRLELTLDPGGNSVVQVSDAGVSRFPREPKPYSLPNHVYWLLGESRN